jgi:hypothetical protein
MDSIDEITSSVRKNGFIDHMFTFNTSSKGELMNIIQYAILAIIPIVLMNKLTQAYIPESDMDKGSIEIVIEVFLQVAVLFVGIYFINRLITYIPTFSEVAYSDLNMLNIVLGFMTIVLSLQTKLGTKVEILSDRVLDYLGFSPYEIHDNSNNKRRPTSVSVSQPIVNTGHNQPSRADTLGNSATSMIDNLPNQGSQQMQSQPQQQPQQQIGGGGTNFDDMYQEPMAANESLGGFANF